MKIYLTALWCILTYLACAQVTGEIIYEDKRNLHANLTEDQERMKEWLPEFRISQRQLIFDEDEAIYRLYVDPNKEEEVDLSPQGRRRWHSRQGGKDNILYVNYENFERVEQREFFDKKFLIQGEPKTYKWKLTGEAKNVGQYTAYEATYADTSESISAWFVPEIAVPLGPGEFGQLPGLVLHVDINNGLHTITAQSIDLRDVDQSEIEKPSKGKKMTSEEFDTMMTNKLNEFKGRNYRMTGRRP